MPAGPKDRMTIRELAVGVGQNATATQLRPLGCTPNREGGGALH